MAKLKGTVKGDWSYKDGEDFNTCNERQEKLFNELQKIANKATPTNPVGAIIKFGIADGHALYRVDSIKPLTLSHIPYHDAWEIDYPYIRGLTLKDVKEMVRSQKAIDKLFGGSLKIKKDKWPPPKRSLNL